MTLPWYGWIALVVCLIWTINDTVVLIINARRETYKSFTILSFASAWSCLIGVLLAGAAP